MSSLVAAGALRAGVQVGQAYIFDYYSTALRAIDAEGSQAFVGRVASPCAVAQARGERPGWARSQSALRIGYQVP